MKSILVVSDDNEIRKQIRDAFTGESPFASFSTLDSGIAHLQHKRYDHLFLDIRILSKNTVQGSLTGTIRQFKQIQPSVEIVLLAPKSRIKEAMAGIKAGAEAYLSLPTVTEEIRLSIDNLNNKRILHHELNFLRDKFWKAGSENLTYSNSPLMKKVFEKIRSVAPTRATVLITGETGTGKGVIAKLIHLHSDRDNTQFISIHCGAIPETLLESELFGHEKGAFTGAVKRKPGKFEIAGEGTIFLDEIGTIAHSAQIKLLQVLQDGIFTRIGGEETLNAKARVIAATNADLRQMTETGEFRKDLFYRLNVFPIVIPPLRKRTEDIPILVDVFLKRLNRDMQKNIHKIHPRALRAMEDYEWPGNIRELENLIERAYILETSKMLTPESFPGELFETNSKKAVFPLDSDTPIAAARKLVVEEFERQYLKQLVETNRGKINPSAKQAGISTRQLHKLMCKYGIKKEEFKK